jgi:hypothetical protein
MKKRALEQGSNSGQNISTFIYIKMVITISLNMLNTTGVFFYGHTNNDSPVAQKASNHQDIP